MFNMAIKLFRRSEPFSLLSNFESDIDRWFGEDWFGIDALRDRDITAGNWTPAVDVEEKDGKYILRADLPGVKKEDIHVQLKDGYLTLSGERTMEHEEKKKNYQRVERSYGSFERSFRVPDGVKEKDIHARYKNGILELTLPVIETGKHKAIEVKVE
jgi:HSP20 family protein